MDTTTETDTLGYYCAHCGLPVNVRGGQSTAEIFCCHACRLVFNIVGKKPRSEKAWNLLRLGFGVLLAMNVMMISLLLYTGSVEPVTVPVFRTVLLALSLPALLLLLSPFIAGAVRDAAEAKVSLDALIATGSVAAFTVSAFNTIQGSGQIYFDTATMVPVLVTVGKILEAGARTGAADLLRSLESLLPPKALRVMGAHHEEVETGLLRKGDLIRVRPGERVAVDGTITEGHTVISEAYFTGEARPRECGPGDTVFAGTVNGTGTLVVKADRVGEMVLLRKIVSMTDHARLHPSRTQRIAEQAALPFIAVVALLAVGTLLFWVVNGNPGLGLLSGLSVLVVACPCSIGIATPLATSLAISRAAGAGIVVRGGDVMERLGKTDMVFFDKTGTVTSNHPILEEICSLDPNIGEHDILARLAALESASEHPLAGAVVAEAKKRGLEKGSVTDADIIPGQGLKGRVTYAGITEEVCAGTESLTGEKSPINDPNDNRTAIEVSWGGRSRGRVLLSCSIRPDAHTCVAACRTMGISTVLLSGDRYAAAVATAREVGIDRVEAQRTPAEKLKSIKTATDSGRITAMVGDGVNDAPALAAAHVGIAMGGGIELARQAGNIVILSDRLDHIPWLIRLSRHTGRIVRQNFAWSFGYNLIALSAAAAGLLHPLIAALAMVFSSLTLLANSLRIRRFQHVESEQQGMHSLFLSSR